MSLVPTLARAYLRKYQTDGVAATGENAPDKVQGRAVFEQVGIEIDELRGIAETGLKPMLEVVRVLTTTALNLADAENGDTVDGVVVATGDRIVRAYNGEAGSATNGVYIVQASGAALRAEDADSSSDLIGARFEVAEGTHAGETWGVRNTSEITLGSTPIVIVRTNAQTAVVAEVTAARDGEATLADKLATKADSTALDEKADVSDVFGNEGDFIDDGRQPLLVDETEDGQVFHKVYSDLTTDFEPSQEVIKKIFDGVGSGYADNIADVDVQSAKTVSDALVRIWADPEGMTLRRFAVRQGIGALKTAVMAGANVTVFLLYGQSNNEGNTNGGIINDEPTYPARVLMLSTGVLGSGAVDSGAASIPDFLPARETVSGALGESPGTAMANAMARADSQSDVNLYIVRNASKGGYTALELAPGSIPYDNLIGEAERIVELLAIAEPRRIDVVLTYLQGETDATGDPPGVDLGTPAATYETRALDIFESAIDDIDALDVDSAVWIINQAGTNSSGSYCYANLPAAVLEKIARGDTSGRIFMGEPHYQFDLYDNYHSTEVGKVKQAELNARTLRLIRAGKQHVIEVESVTRVGSDIHVDFLLPDDVELELQTVTNLVQYGFKLHSVPFVSTDADDGTDIAINSAALATVGNMLRRVVLTPATAPIAGQELRYAFKDNTSSDGDYYNARGGLATTSTDLFELDGTPMRFYAPVFIRTLT